MLVNNCHLKIQYKEATDFILSVSKYGSKITFEDIMDWIKENCSSINPKESESYLNKTALNLILGSDENGK